MKLLNTQYLYINSANRNANESVYSFSVLFNNGDVSCKKDELMKVGVQSFDLYHTWTYVNSSNNTICIQNGSTMSITNVSIPFGNYTYKQLASLLTTLYANWTVTWSPVTNKFTFTFTQPHGFVFNQTTSAKILGLTPKTPTVYDTSVVSDNVLRSTLSERINVHIDNLTPYDKINLENTIGSTGTASTKVLSIINNFSPFDVITYENSNNLYSFFVSEKTIEKINISLRDVDSALLTFVTENFNIVLKVETYQDDNVADNETNNIISNLQGIKEYLRLMFVSANLAR